MAIGDVKAEIPTEKLKAVINPWLLGADPEFAVFTPPRRIFNQGEFSCNGSVAAGAVGQDHGGRVWELRPTPAQSAYGLLTNVWRLLKDPLMTPVERFKWRSGGLAEEDTIGGHVHFGFRGWQAGQLESLSGVTTNLERLDILPSGEGPARRETHPDYGNLLGQRSSGGHVEYRAPASWLDRPGQALAVLTTYKLAALEPQSTGWRAGHPKQDYLDWVALMSQRDVDAFILWRLINRHGLEAVQADPDTNFRTNWGRGCQTLLEVLNAGGKPV
jgi:hypothetical protein